MGEDVTLVSSAEETAKDVYRTLVANDLLRDPGLPEPVHQFMVTGDPADFQRLGPRFLGPEIGAVEVVAMRLTVVGCAGSYPNPSQSPASCYLVEHDGDRDRPRPRQRRARGRCSSTSTLLDDRRRPSCSQPLPRRPLRRRGVAVRPAPLRADAARRRRCRCSGRPTPESGSPPSTGWTDRGGPRPAVRRPHARCRHRWPSARSRIEAVRAAHPVEAYCDPGRGRRPVGHLLRRHRSSRRAGRPRPRNATSPCSRRPSSATDNPPDLHLTGAEAGRIASEADVGLLLLTHHVAWNDEAEVLAEAVGRVRRSDRAGPRGA